MCTGKTVYARAIKRVVKELIGDYVEEFKRLYNYRDSILNSNLESIWIVDVNTKEGKNIFRDMYVCFSAMKQGFSKGWRKYIRFDCCFLKGAFKGQLLPAVSKNGNNQIYPLAWVVVLNDTIQSWTWFIEPVSKDFSLQTRAGSIIVIDMQKVYVFELVIL